MRREKGGYDPHDRSAIRQDRTGEGPVDTYCTSVPGIQVVILHEYYPPGSATVDGYHDPDKPSLDLTSLNF
jgi:hypothetical protein